MQSCCHKCCTGYLFSKTGCFTLVTIFTLMTLVTAVGAISYHNYEDCGVILKYANFIHIFNHINLKNTSCIKIN
jgi:hypothetical protein